MTDVDTAPRPREDLPEHVTVPLLTRITQSSLDQDYRVAAERRAAGSGAEDTRPPLRRRRNYVTAGAFLVLGVLVVTAAVQSERNAGIDATGRATLISQINANRANFSEMQDLAGSLRAENARLEAMATESVDVERTQRNRLRRLRLRTGHLPVTGPGVRIEVDDAPDGDATQAVRDEDLAILVNGLWRAGAEAIAVNDQRLTALSAFANRGPAILLNSRPLNPPYVVQAIGDPGSLQANFANTTSGLTWLNLQQSLGFEYAISNDDSISLPAARPSTLRSATQGLSTDRDPTEEDVAE